MKWGFTAGSARSVALTAATVLLLAPGCASAPTAQRTEAMADIKAAEQMGAEHVPQAALHLALARDGLAHGEKLIREDEEKKAKLVLQKAEADAELAVALVKETEFRADAKRVLGDIRKLQNQLGITEEEAELDTEETELDVEEGDLLLDEMKIDRDDDEIEYELEWKKEER